MKGDHPLNMLTRLAILITVAIVAGLAAIWLSGRGHDLWKIVSTTVVFLFTVGWLFVRWYVPRQP
jgi:hypothetical protein